MSLERLKDISIRDELFPGGMKRLVERCPFPGHKDKTPSFSYRPGDNSCKCFGCGRGGSAIDFWMHLNNMDFRQAVEDLSERFNIPLEKWTPEQEAKILAQRKKEDALNWAADYFVRQLAEGSPEWAYLTSRGFTAETIRELRIGYANKTMLATITRHPALLDDVGLTMDDLEKAGVLAKNEETGRRFDWFRDRLTFPITKHGRVVGISARALPAPAGAKEQEPKYLNLNGVPLDTLILEENIRNEADVCEGIPDTITLHQLGFPACGQQGTSGMEKHARKFKRCGRVFLWFDTDQAGQKAIARVGKAIHMELASGEVRVVSLPSTVKDINEYFLAGNGPDEFRELRAQAPTLIEWLLARIPDGLAAVDQEREIKELLRLVVPLGPIQREHYLGLIRVRFKLRMGDLRQMLESIQGENVPGPAGTPGQDGGVVLGFKAARERIPAQCFAFNSPATGNTTVYLPVTRKDPTADGRVLEVERWEPVMIATVHLDGGMKVEAKPCEDLGLSDAEARRIPFESTVRGRWRLEGKHPHSVERFIKGEAPTVNGWDVFGQVRAHFERFIWLVNPADHDLLATWTMMTYVFQLFDAIGYIHLTGTRESGKSNIARLLEELCFNAMKSSSQTGPVLFRSNEANCGTRIMEEAERLNAPKPGTPEYDLMLMCNDGYKRGARAERMDETTGKGGKRKLVAVSFDLYSPKVLVSINDLNYVLASRCIAINCVRARAEDLDQAQIKDLSQSMHWERKKLAETRDQLHCWALQAFPVVFEAYQALLEDPTLYHLRGREREMWLPLLAIALYVDNQRAMKEAGGDQAKAEQLLMAWDDAGQTVQHRLIETQKAKEAERRVSESDQSIEIAVLKALYNLISEGEVRPQATDLAKGDLYVINDLAKLVGEELNDLGLLAGDRGLSGRRFTAILFKTGAASKSARDDAKVYDETGRRKTKRCMALDLNIIKAAIVRLGGKVSDDAASG